MEVPAESGGGSPEPGGVPVFYILSRSRSGDSYWDIVHFVVQATDQQLESAEIVCDFEAALIDSLQTQFPNAIVSGCLFHLKQAFRRTMKRYAIPEEECVIAMTRGVLDPLTVIDPTHIARGIKWVKKRDQNPMCRSWSRLFSFEI
ncbi:unnamed protein product [Phytophthora fragariaefolia]|uniref:Unnamed protein product n=1 Tax=Phytophthora fragariaefolia TaxID=1490495 RepID=A0A9W7CSV9_9STRA|nr:unnamed protein product [Phytophthora fragariaefolia]